MTRRPMPAAATRLTSATCGLGMASLACISTLIEEPALHPVVNQSERCLEVLARRRMPFASKLKLAQRTGVERIGSEALAVGDRANLF
jgi:hypothetical protein